MIVAALTWDIEEKVRVGTAEQRGNSACPTNCLYVPDQLRSEDLDNRGGWLVAPESEGDATCFAAVLVAIS